MKYIFVILVLFCFIACNHNNKPEKIDFAAINNYKTNIVDINEIKKNKGLQKIQMAAIKWVLDHHDTVNCELQELAIADTTAKTNALETTVSAVKKLITKHEALGEDTSNLKAFLVEKQEMLEYYKNNPERSVTSLNYIQKFTLDSGKTDFVYIHTDMNYEQVYISDSRLKEWERVVD